MSLPVNAVLNSGLSVQWAAQEYDVPKSTLSDHVTGRVLHAQDT